MTIKNITLIPNEKLPKKQQPIREKMDIYIPNVPEGLSRRNGMIYCLVGSGGSGKTSLLLNMFKSTKYYRSKFHSIFYICPNASFSSIEKHPFSDHDKVYHELTVSILEGIYDQLNDIKENSEEVEYSCVIIDDFANVLKDNDIQQQLNKMLIKSRHLQCSFIFSIQSYYYFPKMLRKQITYATLFKPNNEQEWQAITKELLHMNIEDSRTIYDFVYNEPYAHLDVDVREDILYKNFHRLDIEK
jgi:hypothetical protein